MATPPAGTPEADWLALPAQARAIILAQQEEIRMLRQENGQLRQQLTALATELAQLLERIGRNSRNSSKPPSSDGQGFKPPAAANPVAAGLEDSRTIPVPGRSCCRSSAAMRWRGTIPTTAAAAAPIWWAMTRSRCAIK